MSGLRKALYLFAVFMLIWAPYRYLTGVLGWRPLSTEPAVLLLESAVKLVVSFGIVYAFLRRYGDSWSAVGVTKRGLAESLSLAFIGSLCLIITYLLFGGRVDPELLGTIHLFLVVGPAEELINRGYFFSMPAGDSRKFRLPFAAILSSLFFSLSHLPIDLFVFKMSIPNVMFHLANVFPTGIILCCYFYSGWNFAGSSLVHATIDFCSAYIRLESETASFLSTVVGMLVLAIIPPLWWTAREKLIKRISSPN